MDDLENAILKHLYETRMGRVGSVAMDSMEVAIGEDRRTLRDRLQRLEDRGLVVTPGTAESFELTVHGVREAELRRVAPDDLVERNVRARTLMLAEYARLYEIDGLYGREYHYSAVARDVGLEVEIALEALDVLEGEFLVEEVGGGHFFITRRGLDCVERWRSRTALVSAFEALDQLNPQDRGRAFQKVLARALAEQGWDQVEGLRTATEEMDVFIQRGREHFVIECKWEQRSVGAPVVRDLLGKLENRVDVRGIIVSHSGFAATAEEQVHDCANKKAILLFGPKDIERVMTGRDFEEMVNSKLAALVSRRRVEWE